MRAAVMFSQLDRTTGLSQRTRMGVPAETKPDIIRNSEESDIKSEWMIVQQMM